MEEKKVKKILKIVGNIFLYGFLFLCLGAIILTVVMKDNNDAVSLFNHHMRVVTSPSMEKCDQTDITDFDIKDLPVGTMIFVEEVPTDSEEAKKWYEDLEEGDVLTFKYQFLYQEVITHRIIDIEENGRGGYYITLQGDNVNSSEHKGTQTIDTSNEFSPNYVLGKVVGQSYFLGSVMSFLKSDVGLVLVIILPLTVITVLELIKLINMLKGNKKEKEQQEKLDEIEELKQKLAELEKELDER